jgi:glycosyltransferase involved in cell wall biosynthesis
MNRILPDSPRVSVGIPLYRSARFIDTIVANIEAMPKTGIEILISDRHGYDDTIDRLRARYGADPRIRFFQKRDELDWVGNINFLLQQARGEYWRFLAHDDLSPPGSLELLIAALDTHPDAVLAYARIEAVDLEGKPIPRSGDHWYPQPKQADEHWNLGVALEMGWNFFHFDGAFQGLVRRAALVENDLLIRSTLGQVFPERGWQFALCLLGRFHFVPEASYIKTYYPASTHRRWQTTGRNLHSLAWAYSANLWRLLGPFEARCYAIWDVWWNARKLARWQDDPERGVPPLLGPAPDPLCWLLDQITSPAEWLRDFLRARREKIKSLRALPLPCRQR